MNITFKFVDSRSNTLHDYDTVIASGTTIDSFLVARSIDPESVTVRHNRSPAKALDVILCAGDLLSICQKGLRGTVSAKIGGHLYRKHKNDKDTIISDCHCHDVDSGDVVDLRTGNVYRKQSKLPYLQLSSKKLDKLRNKLLNKGELANCTHNGAGQNT